MSRFTSTIKQAATGITVTAAALAIAGTAVSTASAASVPFAKAHHVSVTVDYQVHEKLTGYSVNKPSTRTQTKDIAKGESNDELAHTLYSESSAAVNRYGIESLYLTEKDSTGTLHVRDYQALLSRTTGSTPSVFLDIDVAPNTVRSYWIYTDAADDSYVHSLVTISNTVG